MENDLQVFHCSIRMISKRVGWICIQMKSSRRDFGCRTATWCRNLV